MRINHEENPLATIERFIIPYGSGLFLEGRIRGITEEGFDDVTWFEGEVLYPERVGKFGVIYQPEVGGVQFDKSYQALKRGAATVGEVEKKLREWCATLGLEISDSVTETVGVKI